MKSGLFFGTFNPIHIGHLIIAQYFLDHAGLDNIRFIVSPHNPLKDKSSLIEAADRLAMVRLAISDNPGFILSDIEFQLPLPSYTVQTLKKISRDEPETELIILMGQDSLDSIEKWKDYQFILENFAIYVYPRKSGQRGKTKKKQLKNIQYFDAPLMDISATWIRENIKNNKSIKYLTPTVVIEYLKTHSLYCN